MNKIMDDPRIDAGVESYPLAELPKGFIERTMGRVGQYKLAIHFQLRFADLAVPVFFMVFALTIAIVAIWAFKTVDPLWIEYMKLKFTYYQLRIMPDWMDFQKLNLMVYMAAFLAVMEVIWIASRPKRITENSF